MRHTAPDSAVPESAQSPLRDAVSRREALSRLANVAGATAMGSAMVGAPARLFAATDDWRVDLTPPPAPADQQRMLGVPFERHPTVRVAIVGTGLRGRSVLGELLAIEGVRITALADIDKEAAAKAAAMVTAKGQAEPALYTNGDHDFEKLVQRDDIDFVYTATPWHWHTPVALAAMRAGKHAGTEVPAGLTIKELWSLVDTSEKTRKHCLLMENCCYGESELTVLRMVRDGLFGEVLHGDAAYLHDLRAILNENRSEGLWRRQPHTERNGNYYTTHGLGPVAQYMGVHRGDRFDYLVSMSTPERGLSLYREATVKDRTDPKWKERYIAGDLNSSLIKTVQGRTILLQHDVVSPRPYSRLNGLQGTKGIFNDYPPRIYIEGTKGGERWSPLSDFQKDYAHPLWVNVGELAKKLGGHGGMDFIMCYRLIQCMREGLAPDFDVYDAAAWSAPGPLSEKSVSKGSAPQKFPDFTRGAWNTLPPLSYRAG
ncbi:MAG: Gfo/Idh/MocA family protein [Gemmatimonas sp.]